MTFWVVDGYQLLNLSPWQLTVVLWFSPVISGRFQTLPKVLIYQGPCGTFVMCVWLLVLVGNHKFRIERCVVLDVDERLSVHEVVPTLVFVFQPSNHVLHLTQRSGVLIQHFTVEYLIWPYLAGCAGKRGTLPLQRDCTIVHGCDRSRAMPTRFPTTCWITPEFNLLTNINVAWISKFVRHYLPD